MLKCEFCEKEFKTKSNFVFHQKTAKYCLEKQGKENSEFKCHYCQTIFTKKQSLENHTEVCKAKPLDNEITRLKKQILNLETQILIKDKTIEEKDKTIEKLEDKLYKILEKVVNKPTTTTNNTNTTNIEKLEMISLSFINEQAQYLTIDHIKNGSDGYAKFFLKYQLQDRVICTDFSRRKIKYKDENGDVITDPEMNSLSVLLFNSIKDRNQELTEKYMDELLNKERNISFYMKMARYLEKQDIEIRNMLDGEKNSMYYNIIKTICSKVLV